jgi:hypothetical protein
VIAKTIDATVRRSQGKTYPLVDILRARQFRDDISPCRSYRSECTRIYDYGRGRHLHGAGIPDGVSCTIASVQSLFRIFLSNTERSIPVPSLGC